MQDKRGQEAAADPSKPFWLVRPGYLLARVRAIDTGSLMTTTRKHVKQFHAFVIAVAVSALAIVVAAPPVSALEGEPIEYDARPGSTLKKEYPIPMPANDAAGAFHEPGLCATVPSCTEIPLKIKLPPGFDPETGDFVILVTLSWNLAGAPDDNSVNDLDLYVYDMNRINEEGEEEPTVAAQSATGAMPEVAKMFSPSGDVDYRILVSNFAGPNQGFTLDFEYKDFSFVPPDEGGSLGGSTSPGGSDDTSFEEEPEASDGDTAEDFGDTDLAAPPIGGPESPALATPNADDDFSSGFSPGGAAGGRAPSLFGETEAAAEAGPVAGAVLAAWLGVAPIALLAAVIAFILKRRPTALSMAFPSGPVAADRPADA